MGRNDIRHDLSTCEIQNWTCLTKWNICPTEFTVSISPSSGPKLSRVSNSKLWLCTFAKAPNSNCFHPEEGPSESETAEKAFIVLRGVHRASSSDSSRGLRFSVNCHNTPSIFPDVWLNNAMGACSLQFEYCKDGIREIEGERTTGRLILLYIVE